jgi:NADH dehydrogenase
MDFAGLETRIPGSLPRVVIVGGGFAGLNAAKGLSGASASVILLDRNNFHLFPPLLYQVATSVLSTSLRRSGASCVTRTICKWLWPR